MTVPFINLVGLDPIYWELICLVCRADDENGRALVQWSSVGWLNTTLKCAYTKSDNKRIKPAPPRDWPCFPFILDKRRGVHVCSSTCTAVHAGATVNDVSICGWDARMCARGPPRKPACAYDHAGIGRYPGQGPRGGSRLLCRMAMRPAVS